MANVMTVTGPVSADELGFTLVHEHVYYGLEIETGDGWDKVYGRAAYDADLLYEQLMRYKEAGGVTLVDQTTGGLRGKDGDILLAHSPNSREAFDRHQGDGRAHGAEDYPGHRLVQGTLL